VAVGLSLAAHAVLLTAAWLHAPKLVRPVEDAGPPQPIIPVLILPHSPPPRPGSGEKPKPIRLHRRNLHPELPPPAGMPPLVATPAPPAPPARPSAHAALRPRITVQPTPAGQMARILRKSPIGCANLAILSRDDRQACLARLGRGAAEAPYLARALGREKRAAFEAAAAAHERAVRQSEGSLPAGVAAPGADSGASYRNKPLSGPALPPLPP
jgi:hypothetical protein